MCHLNKLFVLAVLVGGCASHPHTGAGGGGGLDGFIGGGGGGGGGTDDGFVPNVLPDGGQSGCEGQPQGCYTVYAHGDHTLYSIDLMAKALTLVGPFNAPMVTVGTKMAEDVITDLAVAPSGTIYVVSHTTLYTADATNGHVTKIGDLGACGQDNVALTFTPDNKLWVADYKGAFCEIDYTASPPTVRSVGKLSNNMAVSGDLVAVADGTMYASAYDLADASGTGSQLNNFLVKVDPTTAQVTKIGQTGYPKLFGVAFALGQVFGFTHDQTGHVVTIDPKTGTGTVFNTFKDPSTNMPISFAGAGVNALVSPIN